MRRLTLILSDLYLPAEAVRAAMPAVTRLPHLDALLRFARSERIEDWRQWLARDLLGETWSPAGACARALGMEPEGAWIATPVRLEARLDHVRLSDRGLLRLPLEQLADLAQEFGETFGPETLIAGGNARALLLRGGPVPDARTVDPARLLDSDVGPALASGPAARELRRLSAEIEMWLPGSRTNAERQRARQPAVTSLWLWGGGRVDAPAVCSGIAKVSLLGGDFFLAALAKLIWDEGLRPAPSAFAALDMSKADAIVELAPMSGAPEESLSAIDQHWFAPLRDALSRGRLAQLRLLANDRVFTMHSRDAWRFWRRKRNWLESLA